MTGFGVWWWVECADGEGCERTHVVGADEVRRHPLRHGEPGHGVGRIVCPECGMGSPGDNDRAEGYCGNCHWWTSMDDLGDAKRAEYAQRRDAAGRHFAERVAADLLQGGVSEDEIGRRRRRYVRDAMGSARVTP